MTLKHWYNSVFKWSPLMSCYISTSSIGSDDTTIVRTRVGDFVRQFCTKPGRKGVLQKLPSLKLISEALHNKTIFITLHNRWQLLGQLAFTKRYKADALNYKSIKFQIHQFYMNYSFIGNDAPIVGSKIGAGHFPWYYSTSFLTGFWICLW